MQDHLFIALVPARAVIHMNNSPRTILFSVSIREIQPSNKGEVDSPIEFPFIHRL
jgi:hypothetical protein